MLQAAVEDKAYYLTEHATYRCSTRTALSSDELLDLAKTRSLNMLQNANGDAYLLIWSAREMTGYVLVANLLSGAIITVIPALHSSGFPCTMRGTKNGEEACFHVKKPHLVKAMQLAGVNPVPMDDPAGPVFYLDVKTRPSRTWNYRWSVRFMTSAGVKTRNIGKESELPISMDNRPPAPILALANNAMTEASGWDGVISLVSRDDVAPVEEWRI